MDDDQQDDGQQDDGQDVPQVVTSTGGLVLHKPGAGNGDGDDE